jgi:branched-chain amino acid aminotransferase
MNNENAASSDRPEFAIMNGQLLPYGEAKISIMAPGLTFAVTIFEGLRGYWNAADGELLVFRLAAHLQRMRFGMALIELDTPPSDAEFADQIHQILRANRMREDCYIRLQAYVDEWGDMTATGPVGSSVVCRARPRAATFESGKHFGVVSWRRNTDDASPPRIKATANYLNSRLAGLEAANNGFGGAVILNHDGNVAEGPGGCIFLRRGESLITPSVTDGILESVTRDSLIQLAKAAGIPVEERRVGRTELYLADEMFYCGTGQEITPMLSVDHKPVGNAAPGPITRRLQHDYDALVRGRLEGYEDWLTPIWGDTRE